LGAILLIAIILLIRRRQQKIKLEAKRSKEEEELRYWLEGRLREGEDPELLKKAIQGEGSNPAMVDEIMERL